MLRPNKYLDINKCVVTVSALVLKELKDVPAFPLTELRDKILYKLGDDVKYNFDYALRFLFLLGKIDYNQENDVLELIEDEVNTVVCK
mgnify:CR=1 FL=1